MQQVFVGPGSVLRCVLRLSAVMQLIFFSYLLIYLMSSRNCDAGIVGFNLYTKFCVLVTCCGFSLSWFFVIEVEARLC